MHIQTLKKKITLGPNWRDNNYEEFVSYVQQTTSLNKTISSLLSSSVLDVTSLSIEVEITVKEKDTGKVEENLDENFWLQVALEEYE